MKKQYLLLATTLVLVIALGFLSIEKWQAHKTTGLTLEQAVTQRDNALRAVQIHDQIAKVNEQAATNKYDDLSAKYTNEKATLCAQIKAAKLAQPLCQ